jgi:hypothetical protein
MIRPYGPGKFNTILDSYVYSVSLDGGCDMETGDSSEQGWFGLMRHGHTIFRDHDPFLETLNDDERDALKVCAGVILSEDSNGFVYVKYYDSMDELDKAWAEIERDNAMFEDESDSEESEG